MKRKIGGIILAVVLAAVGTIALVAFVNQAKDEAIKDEIQVDVLVVTSNIRQGAPIGEIDNSVELTKVPQRLVAPDALTTLADVDPTLVAGIELRPGDQLLRSRLVDPTSLVRVDVPAGLQELTLAVDPERAIGGAIKPGDKVGFVISFEDFNGITTTTVSPVPVDPNAPVEPPPSVRTTKLTLNDILITSVQLTAADVEAETTSTDPADEASATKSQAPSGQLLVTFAVSTPQAEQIVFAAEFGLIWLTLQNDATTTDGSRILTTDQIYVTVPQ